MGQTDRTWWGSLQAFKISAYLRSLDLFHSQSFLGFNYPLPLFGTRRIEPNGLWRQSLAGNVNRLGKSLEALVGAKELMLRLTVRKPEWLSTS